MAKSADHHDVDVAKQPSMHMATALTQRPENLLQTVMQTGHDIKLLMASFPFFEMPLRQERPTLNRIRTADDDSDL